MTEKKRQKEELKKEIRFYFETHFDESKDIAARFKIPYRTLMDWASKEGWEKGKAVKNISTGDIKTDLVKQEFGTIIDATANKIKSNIKAELGETYYDLNDLIAKNLLDNLADELLMKAMGINFLQKNMAMGALIAKDELTRMVMMRKEGKSEPAIIAMSEKFVNILATLQKSFYGNNDATLNLNVVNVGEDLSKLSQKEIADRLAALEAIEAKEAAKNGENGGENSGENNDGNQS